MTEEVSKQMVQALVEKRDIENKYEILVRFILEEYKNTYFDKEKIIQLIKVLEKYEGAENE